MAPQRVILEIKWSVVCFFGGVGVENDMGFPNGIAGVVRYWEYFFCVKFGGNTCLLMRAGELPSYYTKRKYYSSRVGCVRALVWCDTGASLPPPFFFADFHAFEYNELWAELARS